MHALFVSLAHAVRQFNRGMAILSAFLIFAAALVLVYEVITRYYLRIANSWVIEFCIFLLIAATFLAAAYTQDQRGHVGIEVLDEVMPAKWNHIRLLLGDVLSLAVVGFIGRNAWHFTIDSYNEGWRTSSTWGPALWIPYSLMAFGLTMLALQMLLQIIEGMGSANAKKHQQNLMGA